MPLYIQTEFTPNAVQPIVCLTEAWDTIKDQYWLFVGISLVALLIGNLAPLGILMAPMMCGVYLAIFQRMRGQRVEFDALFKGFDYFGDSLIAMLIHLIPVVIVLMSFCAIFVFAGILMAPQSSGGEPDPARVGSLIILIAVLALVMVVTLIAVGVIFTFAFPLIVERKMTGIEAVKLSMKAGLANFWGLLGLLLLNALLGMVGALFCYVGAILFLPLSFTATACAYRQVFGLGPVPSRSPYPPPPPGSFV
ncbi:MAG: hypothetical protein M3R68_02095 [Acidobacteriota bacterium]|nr:hypothetical protein [Acidobacteriota bacterium]